MGSGSSTAYAVDGNGSGSTAEKGLEKLVDLLDNESGEWDSAKVKTIVKLVQGNPEICKVPDEDGDYALMLAVRESCVPLEILKAIFDANPAAIEKEEKDGNTCLHWLLNCGMANPDRSTIDKADPPEAETVSWLVQSYPKACKIPNFVGMYPLHCAARVGMPTDVLRQIYEHHTEAIWAQDKVGNLPLHWALQTQAYARIQVSGAGSEEINGFYGQVRMESGCTQYESEENDCTLTYQRSFGVNGRWMILDEEGKCAYGCVPVDEFPPEQGWSVEEHGKGKDPTPQVSFTYHGIIALVDMYVSGINVQNTLGVTPFHIVVSQVNNSFFFHPNVFSHMLESGGDGSIIDKEGIQPSSVAAISPIKRVQEWGLRFGVFLGEYRLDKNPKHRSATCMIYVGKQIKTASEERSVALKFMSNEDQFNREVNLRKLTDDQIMDDAHVLTILEARTLTSEEVSDSNNPCKGAKYKFLLVMEKAHEDLSDVLSHQQDIAGRNKSKVRDILLQTAQHLEYLALKHRTHGDVKARNQVRLCNPDGSVSDNYRLIDLDAASEEGTVAGTKKTSSAYWPPELALYHEFDGPEVLASPQLDMWQFGILAYQVCMVGARHIWHADQEDEIETDDIYTLANQWDSVREKKLRAIHWHDARCLIGDLLKSAAEKRPADWRTVLEHDFFQPPMRLVVSSPGKTPDGELVMSFVSGVSKQFPDELGVGFDWAESGNSYSSDAPVWKDFGELSRKHVEANCRCGTLDNVTGKHCDVFVEMIRTLERADWLKDFRGKVRGNIEGALQNRGKAVAICIEGGPVSQVENAIMTELCAKVKVHDRVFPDVVIERYRFKEFKDLWSRRLALQA
eukprot:TRINITY_DN65771_c0_g1_i1.p1 TRINITY_DN65771_c0_g1~~TRINITY_DN65771_c0_g1_i1.p1  ORF type:complete len:850 (+),score=108.78 TRINITY_DN65771_c0_g1_i1:41-2590(+)